jgi:hypothetical protein
MYSIERAPAALNEPIEAITVVCTNKCNQYITVPMRMVAMGQQYDLSHLAKPKENKPKDDSSTIFPNDDSDRWTLDIPVHQFRTLLQTTADNHKEPLPPFDEAAPRKFLRTCLLKMRRGQTTFNLRFLVTEDFEIARDGREKLTFAACQWYCDAQLNGMLVGVTFVTPNAHDHASLPEGYFAETRSDIMKWNEILESPTPVAMVILHRV